CCPVWRGSSTACGGRARASAVIRWWCPTTTAPGRERSLPHPAGEASEGFALRLQIGQADVLADVRLETRGVGRTARHAWVGEHAFARARQVGAVLDCAHAVLVDALEQFAIPLQHLGAGVAVARHPDARGRVLLELVVE